MSEKGLRMKKLYSLVFAIVLLSVLLASFSSCSTEPPELDTVKEEYIKLIEASSEVNEILFGKGLPVYERDGSEEDKQVYVDMVSALDEYESVRMDCKYLTIDSIKAAADDVYTSEYLETVYEMMFVGYADEVSGVTSAKFLEWDGWLYQNMNYEAYIEGKRTFNYDSMEIVKPSDGEYVNIKIESELDGEKLTITLAFSLTENGWRLDTPTY